MQVDWTHLTPWTSLAGGLLIGATAAFMAAGFTTVWLVRHALGLGAP